MTDGPDDATDPPDDDRPASDESTQPTASDDSDDRSDGDEAAGDEFDASDDDSDGDGSNHSHPDDQSDGDGSNAGQSSGGSDDGPASSITSGSLGKPLFHLAWPVVVIQLLQVTYNVVDTLYLGRLSADAVGAISLAFPLIFLMIAVAGGFTAAGAILVAQYTGARGDQSAGLVAGQTVGFVGALSVVIAVVGFFYTRPALELLPSDPETSVSVIPLAADYMELIFLGMPLLFGFFVFEALMRGSGDTRTPMLVMVLSLVVNVIADPFLIFGFEENPLFGWLAAVPGLGAADLAGLEAFLYAATGFAGFGIEGAALATVLARGVGTAIGLWILFATDRGPDVAVADLAPDFGVIEDVVRLGVPTMLEQSMSALAMIALTAMVVTFSPPVVAAYGLGNRLITLVFLPAMGLGRAIDTVVGQNLGAGRPDRAARAVWLAASTGAGVMLLVAVIAVTLTEPIVSVFLGDVPDAPETIALGVEYVRIRSVEFAFIGVSQVLLGGFRGAGNTVTAMILSFLTLWVGRVASVFALVFLLGWGETGIWIGMALGNILGAVVGVPWFLRGGWKEAYIEAESVGESGGEGAGSPGVSVTSEPSED